MEPRLRRSLGAIDGVFLVIGITIGAGIFSTPQRIAACFGDVATILGAWVLVGSFAYVGGLIYAELGTRLPDTGGEYVYLRRAFGRHVAFLLVWSQLLIIRTSPAAGLAIITVDYFGTFVELKGIAHTAACLAILVAIGALNIVGLRRAATFQAFSSLVKVGGLVLLVVVGFAATGLGSQPSLLGTEVPATLGLGPFGNAAAALMMIVFSYLGFDRVGCVAGEMKNPRRTLPRSILVGIVVIIIVYVLANVLYHQTLGIAGVRAD